MYYVVLQVEDDGWDATLGINLTKNPKVVGLFRAPTKFCDNSDQHRGRKTDAGWSRGSKYGWWVCGRCKKPTQSWSENLNAVLGAARNLLSVVSPSATAQTSPSQELPQMTQ